MADQDEHWVFVVYLLKPEPNTNPPTFSAGALLYKVSKSYPSCPITEVISFRISCFWLSFQDSSTTSGRALDVQTSRACSKEKRTSLILLMF